MLKHKPSVIRHGFGIMVVVLLSGIAVGFVYVWLHLPPIHLPLRLPSEDGRAIAAKTLADAPQGFWEKGEGVASTCTSMWPRFRGPDSDGVNREKIPLADQWTQGGPRVLWQLTLGEGHAGAAVYGGCVYLLDYERSRQRDAIRCVSLDDGRELWRYSYPVVIKRNHGMSRTIPAVSDRYVVTMGPKGHVICLDRTTGRSLWRRDMVDEFGTTIPPWYAGQCPMIDGDRVIVAPAGDSVLMVAIDCATGRIIWQTPNPRRWGMSHSSIVPMDADGRHLYLYCALGGLAAIDAHDGSLRWLTDEWRIQIATIPSPIVLDSQRLVLSGGYNAGSALMQISSTNGIFYPQVVRRWPATVFGAEQQTPIMYNGFVYGIRPDGQLVCLDVESGNIRWVSGHSLRFGLGPLIVGDGKIFSLTDTGRLVMIRAEPERLKVLDQAQVLDGPDAWAPMALAGGRLLARDLTRLVCLDLRRQESLP